jgi:long-chain acyl-CoA synthetase
MYGGLDQRALDIAVTYQDGRKGTLSAQVAIHDVAIHDVANGAKAGNAAQPMRATA